MKEKFKVLVVIGTRPEAIKMAPVINLFRKSNALSIKLCITAQHREMLDQVLDLFEIKPDFDLNIMQEGQDLTDLTARILLKMRDIFLAEHFDLTMVHGDTTTSLSASLSSYYHKIPVAHIEAGLRTNDIYSPWPEEFNRQAISRIAELHFAPTTNARKSLINEGIDADSIYVTGNTVVDALTQTSLKIQNNPNLIKSLNKKFPFISSDKRLIIVTCHRRENFGKGILNICHALIEISKQPNIQIAFSVHPNPFIKNIAHEMLGMIENIYLIEPQEYLSFIYLMTKAYLIITDSGGIQEEAPSFKKPVLVTRNVTERQEALNNGMVKLVGSSSENIINETLRIINNDSVYALMIKSDNPFGDGNASNKILDLIISNYNL